MTGRGGGEEGQRRPGRRDELSGKSQVRQIISAECSMQTGANLTKTDTGSHELNSHIWLQVLTVS
jgi:hypothetical protein